MTRKVFQHTLALTWWFILCFEQKWVNKSTILISFDLFRGHYVSDFISGSTFYPGKCFLWEPSKEFNPYNRSKSKVKQCFILPSAPQINAMRKEKIENFF